MPRKLLAVLLSAAAMIAVPAEAQELRGAIRADMPSLLTIYRDLHANPELSMQETRSAGIMACMPAGTTPT
jgi:hippurate hydrolase